MTCPSYDYTVSVLVVSFNTCDLLRNCLQSLLDECRRLPIELSAEILVVDNGSRDGSAAMVEREFSTGIPVRLIRSAANLGFGAANNLAIESARGKYLVLLNSDAFLHAGALSAAIGHMDACPDTGVGGGRQVSRDGAPQPSARRFPSVWRDALVLTGLSGAPDDIATSPDHPADADWVPGAFAILRREALQKAGLFDPAFFFYSEEVDLCRRIKAAGFRIVYWPDIVITHIGGESARKTHASLFSERGAQVVLWRMRSTLLYYRKHHGGQALLVRWLESGFYRLRSLRNRLSTDPERRKRVPEFAKMSALVEQAWRETHGGRTSPKTPW